MSVKAMTLSKNAKKEMKSLWKKKEREKMESAELVMITSDYDQRYWKTRRSIINYSAKIEGIKLYLTRDEGSRETYGENVLLGRHFLEKQRWQDLVKKDFGEDVFNDIKNLLIEAYKEREIEVNILDREK